ncbi:MAG: PQQ-binding-like beta-propeller repeat protein [Phycisphaerae bacterium]|jgi:outer membrane protein assembly factor BamB|nr:PQQ-binding-like beta-propeller repeat protein [Phycisphaerae bacterium]
MNNWKIALASISLLLIAFSSAHAAPPAAELLGESGVSGGIAVHVGCGGGKLTAALHTSDRLLVHGLDTDPADVARAQKHIDSLGLYGKVSAERYDGKNLPHGDNIVNLLLIEAPAKLTAKEIERVLTPRGVVLIKSDSALLKTSGLKKTGQIGGWTEYTKPWPEDIDQWTHFLYDASGNAVSRDRKVGHPRRLQWWAPPKHARHHDALASLSAMTSSNGRLFYIYDEGSISVVHRPPDWKLIARDAFNGKLLWKRDIPTWMTHLYNFRAGPKQLPRRLVSVGDSVYVTLGLTAPAVKLDAATGKTLATYPGSDKAEELIYHDGMLLVVKGDPNILIAKSDKCFGYWQLAVHEKALIDKSIVAYDAKTGKKLWSADGENLKRITPLSLCARGDKVFYLDSEQLHCLSAESGKQQWASEFKTEGQFIRSYAPTVVVRDDVIMCLTWNRLHGFAVKDGKKLWENKGSIGFGSPGDLFVIGDKAWTAPMRKSIWRKSRTNKKGMVTTGINIPGENFLKQAKTGVGVDINTGEITDELPFVRNQHHHRCYRNKATEKYVLIGHSGIQLVDVKTKKNATNQWVRGICQYGIMPANGYIYVPPDPCQCYNSMRINGFFALMESSSADEVKIVPALEKGSAWTDVSGRKDSPSPDVLFSKDGWPTYRGGISRSGSAKCELGDKLKRKWEAKLGDNLTAPVIAGDKVFVAQKDAYTVHCLARADGKVKWKFLAAGPIDSPPTIYKGLCIVGCSDGSVYCLNAADGRLGWRFKVSAVERRVGSGNRLESPLAVSGSVLIMEDVAYFAAGRSSFLDGGIRLYGLDVWTGEQKYSRIVASGYWGKDRKGKGALVDVLISDGNTIAMREMRMSKTLRPGGKGGGTIVSSTGLLDSTWFHRKGWKYRKVAGQLVAYNDGVTVGVGNPYTRLKHIRKSQAEKYKQDGHLHQKFTRYEKDFFVFGSKISAVGKKKSARGPAATSWSIEEMIQPRAMVLAGKKLFLAGWLDSMAIELKTGRPKSPGDPDPHESVLQVYSVDDGKRTGQYKLESDPVFDGAAAAYGQLFISLKNGKVVCMD